MTLRIILWSPVDLKGWGLHGTTAPFARIDAERTGV